MTLSLASWDVGLGWHDRGLLTHQVLEEVSGLFVGEACTDSGCASIGDRAVL